MAHPEDCRKAVQFLTGLPGSQRQIFGQHIHVWDLRPVLPNRQVSFCHRGISLQSCEYRRERTDGHFLNDLSLLLRLTIIALLQVSTGQDAVRPDLFGTVGVARQQIQGCIEHGNGAFVFAPPDQYFSLSNQPPGLLEDIIVAVGQGIHLTEQLYAILKIPLISFNQPQHGQAFTG